MKQTKTLKTMLWLLAFFMEVSALLFYFRIDWQVIHELAGTHYNLVGIEFLMLAVLFTVAALLKNPNRLFIGFLGSIMVLYGIYFLELLLSQNWSATATEILIADTLFTLAMGAILFAQLRKTAIKATATYAS